jgi:hypothetical protein
MKRSTMILLGLGIISAAVVGVVLYRRRGQKGIAGYPVDLPSLKSEVEEPDEDDPVVTPVPYKTKSSRKLASSEKMNKTTCWITPDPTDHLSVKTQLVRTKPQKDRPKIGSSAELWRILKGRPERPQEEFEVVLLDNQNRITGIAQIAKGESNGVAVVPSDVLRPAILSGANRVILVHNHPSGSTTPSSSDQAVTTRMKSAGELLGITILDHIVVGEGGYGSLRDMGMIR